jgi:hypothetical protein
VTALTSRKIIAVRPTPPAKGTPEWFELDSRRNEQAARARLRRDAAKPIGETLKEGAALSAFAKRFAAAFAKHRR